MELGNVKNMNVEKIKKDFSLFDDNNDFVYLDTAATSLTPESVIKKTNEYYRNYRANIHRGLYKTAEKATEEYEKAREKVAQFIGADKKEIIFTAGATASSNMLIYAIEHSFGLKKGDEIVTTKMEHHAGLLPLQRLVEQKRLSLKYIDITEEFKLDYEQAKEIINEKTKIVSVILASNVLGTVNDVKKIVKFAKDIGVVTMIDATAGIGHFPIDVKELEADFLYFSGHKMCAPTGIGVLYGKKEKLEELEPGFLGGGMVDDVDDTCAFWTDVPEKFEAGTPNISGAIGFGEAVDYLQKVGLENIQKHCQDLLDYAYKKINEITGVKIYSAISEDNVGILSFVVRGVHAHDVAEILAKNGIAVRAGHHCALPLHKEFDLPATVRASFYLYNTKGDVDKLVEDIKEVKRFFV